MLHVVDAGPKHCVRFSRTGLPIGEHCAVEAIHHAFNDRFDSSFENLWLRGVRVEHLVVAVLDFASRAIALYTL